MRLNKKLMFIKFKLFDLFILTFTKTQKLALQKEEAFC